MLSVVQATNLFIARIDYISDVGYTYLPCHQDISSSEHVTSVNPHHQTSAVLLTLLFEAPALLPRSVVLPMTEVHQQAFSLACQRADPGRCFFPSSVKKFAEPFPLVQLWMGSFSFFLRVCVSPYPWKFDRSQDQCRVATSPCMPRSLH